MSNSAAVVTYNIHHGAEPKHWARLARTAGSLAGLSPDLIALQEVDHRVVRSGFRSQPKSLAKRLGMHEVFAPARRWGPGGLYGIAVLSKVPLQAVEYVRLPRFDGEQRLAILGQALIADMLVSIAAVHLHYNDVAAPHQLEVVCRKLLARPAPHLMLGDFNVGAELIGPTAERFGFTMPEPTLTFPATSPRDAIDWILGNGLTVSDIRRIDSNASDHCPLVAHISR